MITLLTFNCNKGNCNINNVCKIINDSNADIICLQEFNMNIASSLSKYELEKKYIFITSPLNQGWSQNVIYSKFPIVKTDFHYIEGKSRCNILITVIVEQQLIDIICAHLEPGRQNVNRRKTQLKSLFDKIIERRSVGPIIIAGDFNMDFKEINFLGSFLPRFWYVSKLLPTFTSDNPCNNSPSKFSHPFDFAIYFGLDNIDVEIVSGGLKASDHYPLLLTFDF